MSEDIDKLIKDLDDEHGFGRHYVAKALGKIGDARAVEPLCKALGDDSWLVRRCASKALLAFDDARAVEPLCAALSDEDKDVRINAADALVEIGDARAVEALCRALGDENEIPHVRLGAAKALGNIGDARAVEPLCGALGDVRNYLTHEYAAEALAKIGDPRAVEPLCKVLGNKDIDDRRQAGRPFAAEALGKIGDARAVETLCEALGDRDGHKRWDGYGPDYTAQTRKKAAQALGKIGGAHAVEALCKVLGDLVVYLEARRALIEIGDERAVEALCKMLGHEDPNVRSRAAYVLGQIGDPRAVEPLCLALSDAHEDVRGHAAGALGQIGDIRAVEPLLSSIRDRGVRVAATGALVKILGTRALPLTDASKAQLIYALNDHAVGSRTTDNSQRRVIGNDSFTTLHLVNLLLRGLGIYEAETATMLAAAFRIEHDDRAGYRYADAAIGEERARVVHKLGVIGDPLLVDILAAKLDDDATYVRFEAASALIHFGDLRGLQPLISVLLCDTFGTLPIQYENEVKQGAHDALEGLLKSRAATIPTDSLRSLSKLSSISVMELAPLRRVPVHDDSDQMRGYVARPLDCSLLAQLSRRELARRGMP